MKRVDVQRNTALLLALRAFALAHSRRSFFFFVEDTCFTPLRPHQPCARSPASSSLSLRRCPLAILFYIFSSGLGHPIRLARYFLLLSLRFRTSSRVRESSHVSLPFFIRIFHSNREGLFFRFVIAFAVIVYLFDSISFFYVHPFPFFFFLCNEIPIYFI